MQQTRSTEARSLIWLPISLPFMDPKCSSPFSEQHANIHFVFSNKTSATLNSLRFLSSLYGCITHLHSFLHVLRSKCRSPQIFHKYRNHSQILGARRVIHSELIILQWPTTLCCPSLSTRCMSSATCSYLDYFNLLAPELFFFNFSTSCI